MSARIFVHPRCHAEPGLGRLSAMMAQNGFDVTKVCVGPKDSRGRREIVRRLQEDVAFTLFERMDGTRFRYRLGAIQNAPGVA